MTMQTSGNKYHMETIDGYHVILNDERNMGMIFIVVCGVSVYHVIPESMYTLENCLQTCKGFMRPDEVDISLWLEERSKSYTDEEIENMFEYAKGIFSNPNVW